jgi:hypothetical protein
MKSDLISFINRSAVAALVSGMVALPVSAHHSASGYDMKKTQTAPATIKEFRWGAPHSAAIFMIKGPKGEPQELPASSAAPASFLKKGFKPRDFKVGDKVEIAWHPTFSGAPGGILVSIKFADGRVYSDPEFEAQISEGPPPAGAEPEKEK